MVCGFHRTCLLDNILPPSPTEQVRRPILRNTRGRRMDRQAATHRLRHLTTEARSRRDHDLERRIALLLL